ncbi:ABC transporter permease subunit [Nonomuraea pusilla]|uniref:ABC transporter permease subunit n=1 Tax=Nonomuraea pusilla TaxID=46177 RepID=UPI00116087C6|nr:hypothetical protein [Nonomuraea pusilla]
MTLIVAMAIVGLSIVILAGLAGIPSLGQFAVAGVAAAVSVRITETTSNLWLGFAAAAVVGGATAAIVGAPALRDRRDRLRHRARLRAVRARLAGGATAGRRPCPERPNRSAPDRDAGQ